MFLDDLEENLTGNNTFSCLIFFNVTLNKNDKVQYVSPWISHVWVLLFTIDLFCLVFLPHNSAVVSTITLANSKKYCTTSSSSSNEVTPKVKKVHVSFDVFEILYVTKVCPWPYPLNVSKLFCHTWQLIPQT